ncbi:MAG: phosphatidylserine decarboxylase [Proteobacteria bacterium]|nr:MAG: phosphatidylserine decarboxylase [Pseudomonadota bacterium]
MQKQSVKKHITNLISTLFGKFASYHFPKPIQIFINKTYVFVLKLDLSEFEQASTYPSLNALFTRKLKHKRQINSDENIFISPSDGKISEQGKIHKGQSFQIKGSSYDLKDLLGKHISQEELLSLENGSFINIYLSPRDYHRFHTPCDMKVLKSIHIPGKLYPVNFTYLNKIPSLFCENERVILVCQTQKNQKFYLIFVGALNVGKIVFNFDERIQTNAKAGLETLYEYNDLELKKGDELGCFQMGSTIVILFEDENIQPIQDLENVRFSDVLVAYK